MVRLKKPVAIICDVEGTTSSTRFWHDILGPFIKDNLETCLRDTWNDPETIDTITFLRNKFVDDVASGEEVPPIAEEDCPRHEIIMSIIRNVSYQIEKRRPSNELKSIQLLVWLYGYKNELIKGHIYPDVQSSFQRWKNELGIRIFTYTTTDIMVQKMLFANTLYGNLVQYIERFFTKSVGRKTDADSYRNISKAIDVPINQIVFLSDNVQGMA